MTLRNKSLVGYSLADTVDVTERITRNEIKELIPSKHKNVLSIRPNLLYYTSRKQKTRYGTALRCAETCDPN